MSHVVKSGRSLRCHVTCKLKLWRPFCFALRSHAAFELSSGGLGAAAPIIKIVINKMSYLIYQNHPGCCCEAVVGQFEELCVLGKGLVVFSRDKLS